jgi:hypothetical protein
MILQQLAVQLREQAAAAPHQITLDDETLGTSGINNLIDESLGRKPGNILLKADPANIPGSPGETSFSFPCTTPGAANDTFLNLSNRAAQLTLFKTADRIDFTLDIDLTQEGANTVPWNLSDSFSQLTGSIFEQMTLSGPHFVFSTCKTDVQSGPAVTLSPGLNFYSGIGLAGSLESVTKLLAAEKPPVTLTLSGLIKSTTHGPVFDLQATLDITILNIGGVFEINAPYVGASLDYIPGDDSTWDKVAYIYFGGTVKVANKEGTEVALDLRAAMPFQSDAESLTFLILPEGQLDTSFGNLGRLVAGNSWDEFFSGPAQPLQKYLNTFGFKSYSAAISLKTLSVTAMSVNIGTLVEPAWTFLDGKFRINWLDLNWMVISPAKNPAMSAIASTRIELFADPDFTFDIEILLPQLSISGSYVGERLPEFSYLLTKFGSLFGVSLSLPDFLPDFTLTALGILMDPSPGNFSFTGRGIIEWQGLHAEIFFSVDRSPAAVQGDPKTSSRIEAAVHLEAEGPLKVADELSLDRFMLSFTYDSGSGWSLAGNVGTTLFGKQQELAAAYKTSGSEKTLTLSYHCTPAVQLVGLEGIGFLSLSALSLELSKQAAGESSSTTTGTGASKGNSSWQVSGEGQLKIDHVFDFSGKLAVYSKSDGSSGVVFEPTSAFTSIPLPIPGSDASIAVRFGGISIVREVEEANQWVFSSSANLTFRGLSPSIRRILPDSIELTFRADKSSVRLSVTGDIVSQEVDLPDINVGSISVPLGNIYVGLSNLSVTLGKVLFLSLDVALGLPQELNNVFGTKKNGQPQYKFFRTYNRRKPKESSLRVQVSAGQKGLKFKLLNSPILPMKTVEEGGHLWWNLDMGRFGAARIMVPEFAFDGSTGAFNATAGFDITRPLTLPLTLLQNLFKAVGPDAVAEIIPDGIELKDINILDDQGRLKTEELAKVWGGSLPKEIQDVIDIISGATQRLPDRLKKYLNITIPRSLLFHIAVGADGSLNFKLSVKDGDPPIRLLYPGITGPLPVLNGIELRSISFGEIMAGQLFALKVDAAFDQFDILTLAASIALPTKELKFLPDSRTLQRTLILENLFAIIIYQTAIPIPVPIFYDEICIKYAGIEGVTLQSVIRFPQPSPSLSEVAKVLSSLVKFFSDRSYLLDPSKPPQGLDLKFTLGPNYVQTPKYLAAKVLGKKRNIATISAYSLLAHMLNWLKTFRLNEFIRSFPLKYRVGKEKVTFFGLSIEAAWAFTTPEEFVDKAYRKLNIRPDASRDVLAILPRQASKKDEGVVLFLHGGFQVAGALKFQSTFGLIASDAAGFASGFRITGTVAGFVGVKLEGSIVINPAGGTPFSLTGSSLLTAANQKILEGRVAVNSKGLLISGDLDLFPGIEAVTARGAVRGNITKNKVYLGGKVKVAVGEVTIVNGSGEVSNDRVYVSGKFLNRTVGFSTSKERGLLTIRGTAGITVGVKGSIGPIYISKVKVADKMKINLSANTSVAAKINKSGFKATIKASVPLPGAGDIALNFTIKFAPANVKQVAEEMLKQIEKRAEKIFNSLFSEPGKFLEGIGKGTLKFTGDTASAVGKVLSKTYKQSMDEAAKLLKGAGYSADKVGKALKGTFTNSAKDAAKALKAAGCSAEDTAKVMKNTFGASAKTVGSFMKDTWKLGDKTSKKILEGVGYSGSQIKHAMKSVFNWADDLFGGLF